MDLGVIILNYKTPELLKKCLESIYKYSWQRDIEVTVVDNHSEDESVEMIKKNFKSVKVIESAENGGFSKGNNLGLKGNKARMALLLNSDTEVREGSLDNLVDFMDRNSYGIGSCKLIFPDGKFQPNAGDSPTGLALFNWISGLDDFLPGIKKVLPSFHRQFEDYYKGDKEVGWVSGSVMVITKETLSKIGFLDENIFMYGEDVEYCLRAKNKRIKVGWTDSAKVMHVGGASSRNPSYNQWIGELKGLIYIYKKYYSFLALVLLKTLIYIFYFLRMLAFGILLKGEASKTYGKILFSI
jgi:GT2 family glycosyltransferase